MRDFQRRIGSRDWNNLPRDPAKTGKRAMLQPAFGQKLHTDANTQKRPARPDYHLFQHLPHAGNRRQPGSAIAERADPGQHDPVRRAQLLGIAGHHNRQIKPRFAGRALERLGFRASRNHRGGKSGTGRAALFRHGYRRC